MTVVYEYPENRRKVLTASGESMSRDDAEALGYTVAPYIDLVGLSSRIATRHAEHVDLAVLPPFGLVVAAGTAKVMGFAVTMVKGIPRADAKPSTPDPKAAWRATIMKLPEVVDRPSAAAELLTTQTPETLTVDAARAFLRGLPVESEHTDTTEGTMTTDIDPRAARLAEIKGSMAAYNASQGRHSGTVKIADGVTFSATRGYSSQPTEGTVDPAKVQRLAEMRYSKMLGSGQGYTTEAKTLKLALDTHATTGAPMDRTLASLGFDVSKLFVTR